MRNLKLSNKKKNILVPLKKQVLIDKKINNLLINQSHQNDNDKSMILIHRNRKEKFQEMLICLKKKKIYKPHVNIKSEKSYHMIKGKMKVVFFTKNGYKKFNYIIDDKKNYYLRFEKNKIHTVEVLSKYAIFFERVLGPHKKTKYINFN